ncbi:heavy metal translocating P-type ATPase [Alicyclobacillus sp. ALC3]|uniref:heavy metal translocating P-type ATPase n=1 Tax=Alicyclobacillus sp. ALC3 TaxID=2796143 RepID=UPI002378D423|nr:cation-translocating P-type ATPase [Alicyclobacillus sp. ALC3]WDL96121.1 cation-translocating P-type ATPase [Alicyclobacillus sp. ALC3]
MAVLTCQLCDGPVQKPVLADGKTFCCHGCRDVWRLLGEEHLAQLKNQPVVDWTAARTTLSDRDAKPTPSGNLDDITIHVSGLWCASCGLLVQHVVNRLPGVAEASINYASESLQAQFDPTVTTPSVISQAITSLGYGIDGDTPGHSDQSTADSGLLWRLAVSSVLSLFLMMGSVPIWSGYLPQFPPDLRLFLSISLWVLTTPVVFWAGWPFLRGAWTSLRHLIPTTDLLVTLASVTAYTYSLVSMLKDGPYLYFDTCGFLVTFLLLGRILEIGTRQRALAVTRHLSGLWVREATVLCDGQERRVLVNSLSPGDKVIVRPGERVPVDGVVSDGTSDIDESFLTGESVPVVKHAGSHVYAGTTNFSGRLVIATERGADDSVLAQTLQFVRDAQVQGPIYRRLTERALAAFIPGVLIVSVCTFCLWEWVVPVGTTSALLRAMAALVIACPCALSVAAPVTSQFAVQTLGREGVLLRSDEAIERCAEVDAVVFDKTGTLTEGQVRLTGFYPTDSVLLQLAASVEAASEHPVGRAIVAAANAQGMKLQPISNFAAHPGEGVTASVNGRRVSVRKHAGEQLSAELEQTAAELSAQGHTLSVLWVEDRPRAVLAFSDTVRHNVFETVAILQSAGVRVHMATGDQAEAARQVAVATGIPTWCAGLTPMAKSAYIRSLQEEGLRVAYVGDGVNDAAALLQANVGIAMGSGTDIAAQAGHLVLMNSRLDVIPQVLATCKKTVTVIRQNLAWATLYNLASLTAAVAGFAQPALAALAMVLSSAFVLGNAMRLSGTRPAVYARRFSYVVGSTGVLFILARYGV